MSNQDRKTIKSKAFAISSIMKHPKLSKVIEDAWNSPTGSTKNNIARSVLKSVHKANSNYYNIADGQGGGIGDWLGKNILNPIQNLSRDINTVKGAAGNSGYQFIKSIDNLINAPQNPEMLGGSRLGRTLTAGINAPVQASKDMGTIVNSAVRSPENFWPNVEKVVQPGINYLMEDPTKTPVSSAPAAAPAQKPYVRNPNSNNVFDRNGNYISAEQAANIQGFWDNVEITPTAPMEKPEEATPASEQPQGLVYVQGQMVDPKTGQPVRTATPEEYKQASENIQSPAQTSKTTESGATDITTPDLTNPNFGTVNWWKQFPPEVADSIYNNLDPSLKDFTKTSYDASRAGGAPTIGSFSNQLPAPEGTIQSDVRKAYDSNMGAEAFAMSQLMDKKALGKKLGMSEEAAAALPEGLLSTNLGALSDAIDKEYRINEQLNNLLQKKSEKGLVKQNFSDYIRGKDEYLGTIDKLIEDADTQISKMDTSNPYVAQRVRNYTNYLTILKGRQNKRYIDFLNMATTQWNAELDQDQAIFDASLKAAEKKLTREGAITTETYNTVKNMLKDLYNNIETREDRVIKLNEAERNKLKDNATIALDILKLKNGGASTQTERDREMNKVALEKYVPEQNEEGTIDANSYLDERSKFANETGDASAFDEKYSPYLSPQDRATLGVGKAVGETATPEPLITDYASIVEEYKNQGWTREEIEKEYESQGVQMPEGMVKALDDVYGPKEGFWGGIKKWIGF